MRMQKESKVVNPESYFEISFNCWSRQFYEVQHDLLAIFEETGLDEDIWHEFVHYEFDKYEDLEIIVIHRSKKLEDFIHKICEAYSINIDDIGDMNLHFIHL